MSESQLPINQNFSKLPSQKSITTAIDSLKDRGINAEFVSTGGEAKQRVLELIPEGSEVMTMTSKTLAAVGLQEELNESGRYQSVRHELLAHAGQPQPRDLKAKANLPEYTVGSVHAVTQDGKVLIASNTGSQLGAYAYGADHVIWVVGAQKIVQDQEEGLKRIYEYSYPLEDRRAQEAYGIRSAVNKILIVNGERTPDRIHMIIVGENLGF